MASVMFNEAFDRISKKMADAFDAEEMTADTIDAGVTASLCTAGNVMLAVYQFGDKNTAADLVRVAKRAMVDEIERQIAESN